MKKYCMLLVVVLMLMVSSAAFAEIILGDQITGLYKNFYITDAATSGDGKISAVAGICWDPTSIGPDGKYNRLYAVENSTTTTKRGLYAIDVYNETEGVRVALTGQSSGSMSTCDGSGNVYTAYAGTPAMFKVTYPTGSAVETKMLGNYGPSTTADDDPASIGVVPTGFGVGTAGQDLVMFDAGIDVDKNAAVTVVYSDSTEANPHYEIVWNQTTSTQGIRGTVSNYDGYAYFTTYGLASTDLNGESRYYIDRVKGDGNLQRILLDIAPENILAIAIDYAIIANPVDGSIWLALKNGSDRFVYRIDVASLLNVGSSDYLADISLQMSFTGTDARSIGNQNLAFSPDGKFLAVGAPDGRDQVYIYSVPEPATIALLGFGMLTMLRKRK